MQPPTPGAVSACLAGPITYGLASAQPTHAESVPGRLFVAGYQDCLEPPARKSALITAATGPELRFPAGFPAGGPR